jgi:hypothetical protein
MATSRNQVTVIIVERLTLFIADEHKPPTFVQTCHYSPRIALSAAESSGEFSNRQGCLIFKDGKGPDLRRSESAAHDAFLSLPGEGSIFASKVIERFPEACSGQAGL